VAVVGAMDLPELMEDAVATGKADIVALGRALLADEQFPKKMLLGMERDITPCIRCQYCVSGGFVPYVPIVRGTMRCAVNPARGREYENVFARGAGRLPVASLADADLADAGLAAGRLPLAGLAVGSRAGAGLADAGQPPVSQTATDQPAAGRAGGSRTGGSRAGASWAASSCGALRRRALIIGGGPAGMEAAIAASDFGHEAILCEKSGSLGGMLRAAGKLPYKSDIRRFLDTLSYRVGARAIDVRLNTEVTPEMAAAMDADAIICAIGAMPATPPIPGLGRALPVHLMREGGAAVGERVVIVGGGLAGIEEAIGLAREGRQVTVVEMAGDIAAGAPYILYRSTVLETQKHPNLKVLTHTECVEVTERGVVVRCAGGGEVGGSAGASAGASVRGSAGGAGAGSGGGAGADAGAGAGACAEPAGMPELTELAADTVISAVGFVPRRSEAEAFRGCTDDFCAIGDCRAVGQVLGAMHDGYDAACRL
jgi:NADPH-dependent 2,4-dienoyl-CoA reductase/sulfur reductase-like enzyme